MKTRLGFVSNSSSSSFCLLGISLSGEQREKFDEMDYHNYEEFDYSYGISDYDGLFLGVYPEKIDEEKTIKQTKEELVEKINKLFPELTITISDISWYTDGGTDN